MKIQKINGKFVASWRNYRVWGRSFDEAILKLLNGLVDRGIPPSGGWGVSGRLLSATSRVERLVAAY